MKKNIPNLLTLLNLLSGSMGVILALKGDLLAAASLVWLGAFFDLMDGLVARALQVSSAMGTQLDALADLISFGLLPAVMLYELLALRSSSVFLPYLSLVLTLCAAWRLARFTIDPGQSNVFIGLSTTAYAIFVSTLPPLIDHDYFPPLSRLLLQPALLVGMAVGGGLLLILPIRFIAFKFSSYSWQKNNVRYTFLLCAGLLVALWRIEGLALSMVLYIALGPFLQRYLDRKDRIHDDSKPAFIRHVPKKRNK
jgi:CDP-diacylglycerol--serine O-phosphatidyltransferase